MREFGQRLAKARKAAGFTQRDIASKLEVCTASVSNWESGNNYPGVELIPDICKLLKITPNYLFGLEQMEHMQFPLTWSQVRQLEGKPVYLQVDWGEETEYNFTGWGVVHKIHETGAAIMFNGRYHFLLGIWYANPNEIVTWQAYAAMM